MNPELVEVICGRTIGSLYLNKFCAGSPRGGRDPACIKCDGSWFTPTAFEKYSGKAQCKSWKKTIKIGRVSMYNLMEQGYFMQHHIECLCCLCSGGESDKPIVYNTKIKPFPKTGQPLFFSHLRKGGDVTPKRSNYPAIMCISEGSNHFKSEPETPPTMLERFNNEYTEDDDTIQGEKSVKRKFSFSKTDTTSKRSRTASPVEETPNFGQTRLPSRNHNNISAHARSSTSSNITSDDFLQKYSEVMKICTKVLEHTKCLHDRLDLMSICVSNLHDDLLNITQTIEMSHLTRLLDNDNNGLQPSDLKALINLLTKFTVKFKSESPLKTPSKTPSKSFVDDVPELITLEGFRLCTNCNRNSKYVCGQCSRSFYCSKFCQTRGWFSHSAECGIG